MKTSTNSHSNTALGVSAMENSSGSNSNGNTALGHYALRNNINGTLNVAVGDGSMAIGSSGNSNTVIGTYAFSNCIGDSNVSIGLSSMNNQSLGNMNVAIGANSVLPVNNGRNQLSIQNVIYGRNMTNNGTIITGNVSIGILPAAFDGTNYAKLLLAGNATEPSLQLKSVPIFTGTGLVPNPTGSGKYLFVDVNGIVSQASLPAAGGGLISNCTNANFLIKNSTTTNTTTCSQVYDNGTSVGIATTSPRSLKSISFCSKR